MCLASYRLKRNIGVDGVYSDTVVATRGITAGSGTAATELKLLLLPLMKLLELQWAKVLTAKVYVDDLTLIVKGKREMMVKTLAMILNFVVAHLEGTLLMQVSKDKSNVVASKPSLALAVAERVENGIVKEAVHATILGTDMVGGAKRCTYQFRSRIWQFLGMIPRFSALREVGANVHQMVRAVAAP